MSGNKQYAPTSRKLKKAREDGDVAKSRDFTSGIALFVGYFCLLYPLLNYQLLVAFSLKSFFLATDFGNGTMLRWLLDSLVVCLFLVGPTLCAVFLSVFIVESVQVGVKFTFKPLAFKLSRLNFFEGLKRIIGATGAEEDRTLPTKLLYDVGKMSFYLIGLGVIFVVVLSSLVEEVFFGDFQTVGDLIFIGYHGSVRLAAGAVVFLLLLGAIDLNVSRKRRERRLRMNAEEFKKELRETEGSPEMRNLRKNLHQEVLLQGIIDGVRRARVVVVSKEGE